MPKNASKPRFLDSATALVTVGKNPEEQFGFVNPPVVHGSTVLYSDYDSIKNRKPLRYSYGRTTTPTSEPLQDAVAHLEGGYGAKLCPSGLSAISTMFLCFLRAGDHLLVPDSTYRPTRQFCDGILTGLGIETTYYDPLVGAGIGNLMKENTRLVYTECPGSQTMEIQDIPAIAKAAHEKGALVALDNTWAAGHYFKAFEHGCDISIQAGTKYLVGHSDAMIGTITVTEHLWKDFEKKFTIFGQCAGPDDMYLALRGMRTLDVRLERHMNSALEIANWLKERPEVAEVLHPALPDNPGHTLWKRDFTGASGLFSYVLNPVEDKSVAAFFNSLTLFGLGFSWGGFESLAIPFDPANYRTATKWNHEGPAVRLHIGLEGVDDLKDDLDAAFAAMAAAS
ncbi:MAG: cystathionine beta-lyase [Hyphomicrobiales bacterium]